MNLSENPGSKLIMLLAIFAACVFLNLSSRALVYGKYKLYNDRDIADWSMDGGDSLGDIKIEWNANFEAKTVFVELNPLGRIKIGGKFFLYTLMSVVVAYFGKSWGYTGKTSAWERIVYLGRQVVTGRAVGEVVKELKEFATKTMKMIVKPFQNG